jgi:methylated-DNA-protein-cysteine methyltransferase-like protein
MNAKGNDFFEQVYQVVMFIPCGRVTSYGAIAKYLGTARSSRLVGWAMNNSHKNEKDIPAHRVVNRNGMLTGKMHFENLFEMEKLLQAEGVIIKNDQILNFKAVFWNPEIEINL